MGLDSFAFKHLLLYGVHVGHSLINSNIYGGWLVFAFRLNILIINLYKTFYQLRSAAHYLIGMSSKHYPVWFVNLDSSLSLFLKNAALSCGEFFVTGFWINGLMSNFKGLLQTYQKLYKISFSAWRGRLKRADKIFSNFLFTRCTWPRVLLVSSVSNSYMVTKEAFQGGSGCFGIVDTNAFSDTTSGPIPGNDDSLLSVIFFTEFYSKTILGQKYFALTRWFFTIRNYGRLSEFWQWLSARDEDNDLRGRSLSSEFHLNLSFLREGLGLFASQNYNLEGNFEDVKISYPSLTPSSHVLKNFFFKIKGLSIALYSSYLNRNSHRLVFFHKHNKPFLKRVPNSNSPVYYYHRRRYIPFDIKNRSLKVWNKRYFFNEFYITHKYFFNRVGQKSFKGHEFFRKFINMFHINRYLQYKGLSSFRSWKHFQASFFFSLAKQWFPHVISKPTKGYFRSSNFFFQGDYSSYDYSERYWSFLNNNVLSRGLKFRNRIDYFRNLMLSYNKLWKEYYRLLALLKFYYKELGIFILQEKATFSWSDLWFLFLKKKGLHFFILRRSNLFFKRFLFLWKKLLKFRESYDSKFKFLKIFKKFKKLSLDFKPITYDQLMRDLTFFKNFKQVLSFDNSSLRIISQKNNFFHTMNNYSKDSFFSSFVGKIKKFLHKFGLVFEKTSFFKYFFVKGKYFFCDFNLKSDMVSFYIWSCLFDNYQIFKKTYESSFFYFCKFIFFSSFWYKKLINLYGRKKKNLYIFFSNNYKLRQQILKDYLKLIYKIKDKSLRIFLKSKWSYWSSFSTTALPLLLPRYASALNNYYSSSLKLSKFFPTNYLKKQGYWLWSPFCFNNITYSLDLSHYVNNFEVSNVFNDWNNKLHFNHNNVGLFKDLSTIVVLFFQFMKDYKKQFYSSFYDFYKSKYVKEVYHSFERRCFYDGSKETFFYLNAKMENVFFKTSPFYFNTSTRHHIEVYRRASQRWGSLWYRAHLKKKRFVEPSFSYEERVRYINEKMKNLYRKHLGVEYRKMFMSKLLHVIHYKWIKSYCGKKKLPLFFFPPRRGLCKNGIYIPHNEISRSKFYSIYPKKGRYFLNFAEVPKDLNLKALVSQQFYIFPKNNILDNEHEPHDVNAKTPKKKNIIKKKNVRS